jgi:replicative DNA helicase
LKQPPHSQDAEDGVLGSVMLDPTCLHGLDLEPIDFYDKQNSTLWEVVKTIDATGKAWDAIVITDKLKDQGKLEAVGGYDRLLHLQDKAVVSSHSQHYASIVKEKADARRKIDINSRALEALYRGEDQTDVQLSELIGCQRSDVITLDEIENRWVDAMNGQTQYMPTPFPDLDKQTGGVRLGMPCVLTGRSKGGKSMLLAYWYNYLGKNNFPILVLPFEDGYDITITRMAANLGKYKWSKIENGGEWIFINGKKEWVSTKQKEIDFAKECIREVSKYPIYFEDRSMKPSELLMSVETAVSKHGVKGFFIDGAKDFLKPSGKYNDVGFDEECSQIIKHTCKRSKTAGVIVHHLTKVNDGELITVNNVRGSGNIIGDCRSVYALQSSGLHEVGVVCNKDEWGNITTRRLDCLAGNHGGVGSVVLDTDLSRCQFWKREGC